MVVEMHAFNITSEDEKKVFISYNLFYYRLAALCIPGHPGLFYPGICPEKKAVWLSIQYVPFTTNLYLIPLVAWVTGFGICMDVTAVYPARITECFHGSCISGTLCLSIYQCTPGCICIIILPSPVCISTIAAEIIKSSQDFIIIWHSFSDIIQFKALYNTSYLRQMGSIQIWTIHTAVTIITFYSRRF